MDNLQEDECRKPSEPNLDTAKQKSSTDFFRQVDKLRAYKEKHGHLDVGYKEDKSLYNYCCLLRSARRFLITGKGKSYKLTEDKITALDAIGFNWNPGSSSTATTKDDKFFARVDKLRAYKEKHGHLNVSHKEDHSLYDFCKNLRESIRAITAGKGKIHYRLDDGRIAALDAIGFNWDPQALNLSSTSPSAVTSKRTQLATNPKINIGDVGYQFLKEFDSGWYNGKVVEILSHALGGWDRRCVYDNGDCEDLALSELKRLATLSSNVGAIKVEEDMKTVEDGGMKVAATEWVSIPAVKEMAVMNGKEEECLKYSNPNVDNLKLKQNINFFDRFDELKAYKEKHGHLHVGYKENPSLYYFGMNVRQARKGKKGCLRLDDGRIAALDAIGFKWEVDASTTAFRDDSFFTRVDKLKAYKEKHGHLKVHQKENESLYRFCIDLRRARKAKVTGKGKIQYTLDETRIAALDAIGFDWNPGTSYTAAIKNDSFFTQVDKLRAYKEEHGHLNVQKKEDQHLYDFCKHLRRSRRAMIAGKGKIHYRLDDDRMAALDAIGFEWTWVPREDIIVQDELLYRI
jgi:hypothetical protein